MPAITSATIQKVAYLSRLSNNDLGQSELDKYTIQIESILEYVRSIQSVDTTGLTATDGWRAITIPELRADVPDLDETTYQQIRSNIINNFPVSKNNLLVIPGIFEEN